MLVPDEFIYSSLARGVAETGLPSYLGHAVEFPAVLTAYLTAPFWLLADTTVAYHLVQSAGALAFSLAAIPVYLLARRLSLSTNTALLLAAGTLVLPDLALSSLLVSEPFAFVLFSFTFWAGHRALLSERSLSDQLLFLVLLVALCLTRTQFIILPVAYLFALVTQGLLDQRLREALRAQLPLLVAFALPLPIVAVLGLSRVFGFYSAIGDFLTPSPTIFVHWLLLNLLVLGLSCGWLLAPGALVGIVATLGRPRDRAERSFALLFLPLLLGQLAQATIISAQVKDAQGRYLIYLLPLLLIQFALAARRGLLTRWPHALALFGSHPDRPVLADLRAQPSEPQQCADPPLAPQARESDRHSGYVRESSLPARGSGGRRAVCMVEAILAGHCRAQRDLSDCGVGGRKRWAAAPRHRQAHALAPAVPVPHGDRAHPVPRRTIVLRAARDEHRLLEQGDRARRLAHPRRLEPLPVDVATDKRPTAPCSSMEAPIPGPCSPTRMLLTPRLRGVEASTTTADVSLFRSTATPVQLRTLVTGLAGAGLGDRRLASGLARPSG